MRYEYDAVLHELPEKGGAYVAFPWDLRKETGKGRLKVHAEFDGIPYDGSIVNMGLKNQDGSVCYIIGVLKSIRKTLQKNNGDTVHVIITDRIFNMLRIKLHVCPICGNVIQSTGEAIISCCGIVLPPLEADPEDDEHHLCVERVEDEYYVTIPHEMSKEHYISFILVLKNDGCEIRKLYPEGNAEARFKINGIKCFYYYCNRHGLFQSYSCQHKPRR